MFRFSFLLFCALVLTSSCSERKNTPNQEDENSALKLAAILNNCTKSRLGDTLNWAEKIPDVDTIPIYALFESTSVNTLLNGIYDARVEVTKIASDSFLFSLYAIDTTSGSDVGLQPIYSRFPCPQICNKKSNTRFDSTFVFSSKFCRIHIDSVLNKSKVNYLSTRFKTSSAIMGIYGVEKSLTGEIHHKNDRFRVFHGQ